MKKLGAILGALAIVAIVFGENPNGPAQSTYDRWTFVGTDESYDELGRPVLVVVCEKRGQREHHKIKHGQDDTYDDVVKGELCPTMANP